MQRITCQFVSCKPIPAFIISTSFPGHFYAQFLESVTGQTIYQETLQEASVVAMAEKLLCYLEELLYSPDDDVFLSAKEWFLEHERQENDQTTDVWFGDHGSISGFDDELCQEEIIDIIRLFRFAVQHHLTLRTRNDE